MIESWGSDQTRPYEEFLLVDHQSRSVWVILGKPVILPLSPTSWAPHLKSASHSTLWIVAGVMDLNLSRAIVFLLTT